MDQPTYTGLTAATASGRRLRAEVGPIGTLPWYSRTASSPTATRHSPFGPRGGPNGFSWANGSRLYYANLTSNIGATKGETFKGFEAIYVSRTDNPQARAGGVAGKAAWMPPVA